MPNHVYNCLEFETNSLARRVWDTMLLTVNGDESYVDFNNIIKTPADIYQGDLPHNYRQIYGGLNWRDWNIENWGTKWNAYESYIDGNCIFFCTAYSDPEPVLAEISKKVGVPYISYYYVENGSFGAERWDTGKKTNLWNDLYNPDKDLETCVKCRYKTADEWHDWQREMRNG